MTNVLIISNNPLSETQHNAKTILSLLGDESLFSLKQIYFRNDFPTYENCKYFKISDNDIIKSVFKRKKAGNEIICNKSLSSLSLQNKIGKKSNFKRLVRECFWKLGAIDYDKLYAWIDETKIDVVFFMGGDCLFAYRIYEKICKHIPTAKRVIFLTDDYILSRNIIRPIEFIRKKALLRKMRKSIPDSDMLICISDKMRDEYKRIFGKDSCVYANMPEKSNIGSQPKEKKTLEFVYAGGLHYNRWKTLNKLAIAIKQYNEESDIKAVLNIYSQQEPTLKIRKKIELDGSSRFCGSLNEKEVVGVMSAADVLVHVESFDKKSIRSTQLSFSTKIFEYLSCQKCVLAIGPKNVASMEYLSQCAKCITDLKDINKNLIYSLSETDNRINVSEKCFSVFCLEQKGEKSVESLKNRLSSLKEVV